MKVKSEFVLRSVAGSNIVVPTGSACVDFNGMITLNDTGAFIWRCMEEDTTVEKIVAEIRKEYDISAEDAEKAVNVYVEQLKEAGCLA